MQVQYILAILGSQAQNQTKSEKTKEKRRKGGESSSGRRQANALLLLGIILPGLGQKDTLGAMFNSGNNSTALEQSDQALVYRMAIAFAEGQVFKSLEEFASAHGLSLERAVSLLASPSFAQVARQIGQAQATLFFSSEGLTKLVQIARTAKPAYAIQAIKAVGELAGILKSKRELTIRLTLESLLAKQDQGQTVEGQVIEADIFDIEGL